MKFFLTVITLALALVRLDAKEDSLKIWWTFDKIENKKINNQTEFSAPLKIRNTKLVSGYKGNAILFKGNKSCAWNSNLAQIMSLADNKPFSISFWMKPETIERRKKHELISKGKDRGPGWRLYLSYGMLTLRIGEKDNKSGTPVILHTNENKIKFIPAKWYHVCIVKNSNGIITIYVNGTEQVKSKKAVSIYPSDKISFSLGNMLGQYYQYEGEIDEFKFYKKALTAIDILKEANSENMIFENL